MEQAEELFRLCSFEETPIEKSTYVKKLRACLDDLSPTITTKDIQLAKESGEDVSEVDAGETGTTPLHKICESFKLEWSEDDAILEATHGLIDNLFYYGSNWMMLDDNNETPGCIALRRGLPKSIYDKFVSAGIRAEVFLRKMQDMLVDQDEEAVDDGEVVDQDGGEELVDQDEDEEAVDTEAIVDNELDQGETINNPNEITHNIDTAKNQDAYLKSNLEYTDGRLITKELKDGVMMDWETPIMEKSAQLICTANDDPNENIVLNVGFGMGIIDTFIQSYKPSKHYISEAHPDVLAKLNADGWYEKPNVIILEGRWQDTLPILIQEGVNLDGIYYDTFSEHYKDMIDFYELVVSLLKPTGVFSFFNGLGADRQICYDVYSQVVELDVQDYGMQVEYIHIKVDSEQDKTWDGIRRQYWTLKEFLLPKITFLQVGL